MSADLPSWLPREPTSISIHYGRQKYRWVCLCIMLLTDLDLFTVCPLLSIVHCLFPCYGKAECRKGTENPVVNPRKPLCQSSHGEGRKAAQSRCTRVRFDHDTSLSDMSHAAITQTWQTLVFFLNTDTLWWDSSVSSLALYCSPLFSFSSEFLLFHNITTESSTSLLAAWEYWAMHDPGLKAADQQHPENINWIFFSF